MKKRFLCLVLALFMALSLLSFGAAAADTPPAGYEGYTVIDDYFDLYDISANMAGKYVLTADIDLTQALSAGGDLYNAAGWIALGYSPDSSKCVDFTGTLDGNGHSIKGLNSNGVGAGLFWSNKGTIRDLTIASGTIQGTGSTAGSFAVTNAGTILNCHNYAAVSMNVSTTEYIFLGGITSQNLSAGTIQASSNHGDISLVNTKKGNTCTVGGIAGSNAGIIDRVWNTGDVLNRSRGGGFRYRSTTAGGIVGYTYLGSATVEMNSPGTLKNAYNTGSVTAENTYKSTTEELYGAQAGGIIGCFYSYKLKHSVDCCYNTGTVTAIKASTKAAASAGGVCGYALDDGVSKITSCYYLNTIDAGVGNRTDDSCKSLTDAQMRRSTAFGGFDFDSVWSMGSGDYAYPVLVGGTGPSNHVYNITNALELFEIRNDMAGSYTLMNDIDLTQALSAGGDLYNAAGWIALGYSPDSSKCVDFTGTLDGNGHSIKGLNSNGVGAGLFWSNKGTIRDLTIASGTIQGTGSTAGSFAVTNAGTILNCHNYAAVSMNVSTTEYIFLGGITSQNLSAGIIQASSNHGDVSLVNTKKGNTCTVGGIAGSNAGIIDRVWNTGDVLNRSRGGGFKYRSTTAGGIVGYTYLGSATVEMNSPGTLKNAYNTGSVTAENTYKSTTEELYGAQAGGIIGCFYSYKLKHSVDCCYNTGTVTAIKASTKAAASAGGVCGYALDDGVSKITYCYYLNTIDAGVGNRTDDSCKSLSAGLMRRQSSFIGFDFDSVWTMGMGDYLYPVIALHEHDLKYVPAVEETCTENGVAAHWICTICGTCFQDAAGKQPVSEAALVLKAAHNYTVKVVAPTCTKEGYTLHTCKRCSAQYIDTYTAKLGHDYSAAVTQPSCTERGFTTHTCSRCGDSYVDSYTNAAGHKGVLRDDKAASCTESGYTGDTYCTVCGELIARGQTIPAKGHAWGDWTVTTPATEESEGTETCVCTVCGAQDTRSIPILAHTHDLKSVAQKDPSCTDSGTEAYWSCTKCGKLYSDADAAQEIAAPVVIPALGHDYNAVITQPSCTERGFTTHTCSRCGDSYVDSYTNAAGHKGALRDDKAASCTESGYTGDTYCTVCGELIARGQTIPAKGHAWGDWTVTTPATEKAEGTQTRTCSVCGKAETRSIPKVTPQPVKNPFVDVKNGDYFFDPVLWALNHKPQITDGTSDTTFSPNDPCTRGQVVTFLWRAMGCEEPTSMANPFRDVKASDYFYKAVLWAVEKGITDGTSDTTFSPNDPCTRAHVVTFLWRAENKPDAGSSNPFRDVRSGQYYFDAVLWAVSKEITDGTSETTFSPDAPCTRGQIVTFLYRDMKE